MSMRSIAWLYGACWRNSAFLRGVIVLYAIISVTTIVWLVYGIFSQGEMGLTYWLSLPIMAIIYNSILLFTKSGRDFTCHLNSEVSRAIRESTVIERILIGL